MSSPSRLMTSITWGVKSNGPSSPSFTSGFRKGGTERSFTLPGWVRLVCRKVPPERSTVRVFSLSSGMTHLPWVPESSRSYSSRPAQPRRMPMTS